MEKQKNIPQLRFYEFSGYWNNSPLNKIATISSGLSLNQNDNGQGIPVTRIETISDEMVNLQKVGYVDTKENMDDYKLIYGDILFSNINSVSQIGKTAIVNQKINLYHGMNLLLIRHNDEMHAYFLYLCLNIQRIKKHFKSICNRAVNQASINQTELSKTRISYPPLKEQQKIASFFTAIDQKISQLKRKKTLLEQYKKGVIQKIFSQEIRFKDDNGQEFPKWEKMTGDALFETVSNKNHNSDLPILAITQEHGAIPRDMIDYYITVSEQSVESYKVVEKGDFIISLRSFQGGIEYSEYTGICSPAYIVLRATQRIDHRYFKYYFKTDKYITDLNRKLEGIRDGKMISYKYFSEIEINVPSLQEQTRISNFLSVIDDKITHTQNQIEKAEVWKKGLTQRMFV